MKDTDNKENAATKPQNGQHYYMDFGFMRGSGFNIKDHEGKTITQLTISPSRLLMFRIHFKEPPDKGNPFLSVLPTATISCSGHWVTAPSRLEADFSRRTGIATSVSGASAVVPSITGSRGAPSMDWIVGIADSSL
jgi:hypothetical protein